MASVSGDSSCSAARSVRPRSLRRLMQRLAVPFLDALVMNRKISARSAANAMNRMIPDQVSVGDSVVSR